VKANVGMNFVALMKYGGPDERVLHALDSLEAGSPEELRAVGRLLKEKGFAISPDGRTAWERWQAGEVEGQTFPRRPALPDLTADLHTPEVFFLHFGPDAFDVWHLLRWHCFLTDRAIQSAMLDACRCLGRLFGATDCVLTSDYSPQYLAFREGRPFDASLAAAAGEDGERPALADLYLEWPEGYLMRTVTGPGGLVRTRYKDWPLDRPVPEGWERATTWDSKGYWRLPLS
jgi:hypothetical protein